MGVQLWIHRDVRDWFIEFRDREPRLARVVGEAVVALIDGGEILGPPLVITQEVSPHVRRAIANVSTGRKRLELIVSQLENQAARLASERAQALKSGPDDDAGQARARAASIRAASIREQISELRGQLVNLTGQEQQLVAASQRLAAKAGPPGDAKMIKAMVLRPGARNNARVGLLFVLPTPDMAVLLAHVTDPSASLGDYQAVIATRIAADGLPPAQADPASGPVGGPAGAAFARYGASSFLDEFFAGEQAEVGVGAGALLARHRVHGLAEVRQRMELTQAQVAQRMNVRQERVSAIERTESGAIEVRTLAAYVAALGGRLEIVAHIDDDRITLADHL